MRYMLHPSLSRLLAIGCFASMVGTGHASDKLDFGKIEYETSCSNCHGLSAKGDGAAAKILETAPADLTRLAAANKGRFPTQRVWQVIDGRNSKAIGAHGPREMPVWGSVYLTDDGQPHELNVRNRIESLVEYLHSLQVK